VRPERIELRTFAFEALLLPLEMAKIPPIFDEKERG